jgi:hypothetical protein
MLLFELKTKGSVGFLSNGELISGVLFCKVNKLYYLEPLANP